jgi:Tfp pilus assembly protein PilF
MKLMRGVAGIVAPLFAAVLCLAGSTDARAGDGSPRGFVGGRVCASCHQQEAALWRGSHHDKAMAAATGGTVLGDFDNATIRHFGVTSSFFRRNGKYFVHTDGPDKAMHDYEIAYTFGVYPLQQYLIAFPGGRYQALGLAWDSRPAADGGQRWFHLYPKDAVPAGDALHWTGRNQTWNYMCADCHSTDLRKNFDVTTNSYRTTWSEINVSCEACHGPGALHVAWAKAPPGTAAATASRSADDGKKGLVVELGDQSGGHWVVNPDTGMPARAGPPTSNLQIDTCARCHSRRHVIAPRFTYGQPLLDSEMPSLLDAHMYHPDGQILDEVYEYGSFLQSRMAQKGVVCSDCHDPHSLQLRAQGNGACAQCHLPAKFDSEAHFHHKPGSVGAQCANCHMPTRTYMVVDARRDHAIRIPRPDLSIELGTPNACNACHTDRSAAWAAEAVAKWYGLGRRMQPHYGTAIDAGVKGKPGADALLAALSVDKGKPAIVRATALSLLPPFGASVTPGIVEAYLAGLKDGDPLVRAAAVGALERLPPDERVKLVAPMLVDDVRAVRIAAVRSLAAVPADRLNAQQRADLDRAANEFIAGEMASSDRPEAHVSIGAFYAQRGQAAQAEAAYRQAMALDPTFAPAMVNLADLYRALDRETEAESLLRRALSVDPQDATAYLALGLLEARQRQLSAALPLLQKAVELAPHNGRYAYVYAVALNSAGKQSDALEVLKRAHQVHAADLDILYALATMSRDAGNRAAALDYAEQLLRLAPDSRDARTLFNSFSGP